MVVYEAVLAVFTTALAALFTYVNVHGSVYGLVHAADAQNAVALVCEDAADDLTGSGADLDGDGCDDSDNGEDAPRPPSQFDEDDVKHFGVRAAFRVGAAAWNTAARAGDDQGYTHLHLDDLERPPRA